MGLDGAPERTSYDDAIKRHESIVRLCATECLPLQRYRIQRTRINIIIITTNNNNNNNNNNSSSSKPPAATSSIVGLRLTQLTLMNSNPVTPETVLLKREEESETTKGEDKEEDFFLNYVHGHPHTPGSSTCSSARSVDSVATFKHCNVSAAGISLGADRTRQRATAALRKMAYVEQIGSDSSLSASTRSGGFDPVSVAVTAFLGIVNRDLGDGAAKDTASTAIRAAGVEARAEIITILRNAIQERAGGSLKDAVREEDGHEEMLSRSLINRAKQVAKNQVQATVHAICAVLNRLTNGAAEAAATPGLDVAPFAMDTAATQSFTFIAGLPYSAAGDVALAFTMAHENGETAAIFLDNAGVAASQCLAVMLQGMEAQSNPPQEEAPQDDQIAVNASGTAGRPPGAAEAGSEDEEANSLPANKRQRTTN